MSDDERHEWASGIHAGLFSLGVMLAAAAWHDKAALAMILLAQGMAYFGRATLILRRFDEAWWLAFCSVGFAILAALDLMMRAGL
jgi:hypothetical protein